MEAYDLNSEFRGVRFLTENGEVRLDRFFGFPGISEPFMLEAEGDSMTGANIFAGDLLVIRRQPTAVSGDIVVAVRESEFGCEESDATLKRYKYKNGKYVLHPENDNYEDIDAAGFRIIGKLKCIVRDME